MKYYAHFHRVRGRSACTREAAAWHIRSSMYSVGARISSAQSFKNVSHAMHRGGDAWQSMRSIIHVDAIANFIDEHKNICKRWFRWIRHFL